MGRPGLLFLLSTLSFAADRIPEGRASDSSMTVSAKLFVDREAIKSLLGSDLEGNFVVVEVTVEPKRKLQVMRDDFLLRTDRDGEKSTPFTGSQIAGRSTLVLKPIPAGGGAVMSQDRGPVYGGIGGPPGQLGNQGQQLGNAAGQSGSSSATYSTEAKKNPLQTTLDEKIFIEKEGEEPVSGLLYFAMEPKQKAKQLELIVSTPRGKLSLRFR
jgi:hypothetical protein